MSLFYNIEALGVINVLIPLNKSVNSKLLCSLFEYQKLEVSFMVADEFEYTVYLRF